MRRVCGWVLGAVWVMASLWGCVEGPVDSGQGGEPAHAEVEGAALRFAVTPNDIRRLRYEGGLVFRRAVDWQRFLAAGYVEITGVVRFVGWDAPVLDLGRLERAGGVSVLDSPGLGAVRAGALVEISGALEMARLPWLASVEWDALESVGEVLLERYDSERDCVWRAPVLTFVRGSWTAIEGGHGELALEAPSLLEVGAFLVASGRIERLDLTSLRRVGRNLALVAPLSGLFAPELRVVEGTVILNGLGCQNRERIARAELGCATRELSLPALRRAGGVLVHDNHRLTRLHLPSLRQSGSINLRDNTVLEVFSLPLFEFGSLWIRGHDRLEKLDVPRLRWAPWVHISCHASLGELHFPALSRVDEGLYLFGVCYEPGRDGDALRAISFPRLQSVGGDVRLSYLRQLQTMTWPSLETTGGFQMLLGNTLRSIDFSSLVDAPESFGVMDWDACGEALTGEDLPFRCHGGVVERL